MTILQKIAAFLDKPSVYYTMLAIVLASFLLDRHWVLAGIYAALVLGLVVIDLRLAYLRRRARA